MDGDGERVRDEVGHKVQVCVLCCFSIMYEQETLPIKKRSRVKEVRHYSQGNQKVQPFRTCVKCVNEK